METIHEVFGEYAFIKDETNSKKINMSLFDIVTYFFAKEEDKEKIIKKKDKIIEMKNRLINEDSEFLKNITASTLSKSTVKNRFDKWIEEFNKLLIEEDSCD